VSPFQPGGKHRFIQQLPLQEHRTGGPISPTTCIFLPLLLQVPLIRNPERGSSLPDADSSRHDLMIVGN
jgi:hypothetical protein